MVIREINPTRIGKLTPKTFKSKDLFSPNIHEISGLALSLDLDPQTIQAVTHIISSSKPRTITLNSCTKIAEVLELQ